MKADEADDVLHMVLEHPDKQVDPSHELSSELPHMGPLSESEEEFQQLLFCFPSSHMATLAHGRSHLRGTGPSSYRTGPTVYNNLGPVPY